MIMVWPSRSMVAPRHSSTSDMTAISLIRGTLCNVEAPWPKSEAAMSFKAEFFAPDTFTSPERTLLPSTTMISFSDMQTPLNELDCKSSL